MKTNFFRSAAVIYDYLKLNKKPLKSLWKKMSSRVFLIQNGRANKSCWMTFNSNLMSDDVSYLILRFPAGGWAFWGWGGGRAYKFQVPNATIRLELDWEIHGNYWKTFKSRFLGVPSPLPPSPHLIKRNKRCGMCRVLLNAHASWAHIFLSYLFRGYFFLFQPTTSKWSEIPSIPSSPTCYIDYN